MIMQHVRDQRKTIAIHLAREGVLTVRDRSVVLFNITDMIANCEGIVSLPIFFKNLLFCGLMFFLFIVNFTHIYVNLHCVYTYIQYIHTVILFGVDTVLVWC